MLQRIVSAAAFTLSLCCICLFVDAQPPSQSNRLVFRDQIVPNWYADGSKFWYRLDVGDGGTEYVIVDAEKGERRPAFDLASVKSAIASVGGDPGLPISSIEVQDDGRILLLGRGPHWLWEPQSKTVSPVDGSSPQPAGSDLQPQDNLGRSRSGGEETEVTFRNQLAEPVRLFWIDTGGELQAYGELAAGEERGQHTYANHRWLIQNRQGENLSVFEARPMPGIAAIESGRRMAASPPPSRRPDRSRGRRSSDGKWEVEIVDHNIVLRSGKSFPRLETEGNEQRVEDAGKVDQTPRPLTTDGSDERPYVILEWSPNSEVLVASQVQRAPRHETHLVQSSPPEGGRAVLHHRPYALPGDPFDRYSLLLMHPADGRIVRVECDSFEHEWERPRLHWLDQGSRFAFVQADRGHQRLRVVEVDCQKGTSRNLVDESSDTFIWTAHLPENGLRPVQWMEKSDEFLYLSEKTGHRHLYLIRPDTQVVEVPLTSGDWVVRGIESIDEGKRQVWFRASGCFPGQDPYLVHYGRVDLDGQNLVWLTREDGNHALQFSPDRRFIIDTYSRVDQPPRTILSRSSDGKQLCQLEQADVSRLLSSGWKFPEVFKASGRDGTTEIWGVIYWPRSQDLDRKYAIVEDIYAGPQDSFVPKSFSTRNAYDSLLSMGCVVVKIDGMGTANRSKKFHDVCWKNLKDGGFEDRILWIKAAAAKHPELDLSRVGVYGVSAGGQNAAAAVIFHPEFYRVAVAACGCHDNRMDKASWNEQWMGYPVGPQYAASSNIDNAHQLGGRLMLILGEMDTNVPPESTMRLADALIRADKDFDLVVVPNAGHGIGGAYGRRRMHDFFREHLIERSESN